MIRATLGALALALLFAGVGLGLNAVRSGKGHLPLVAPMPYESDCPEKIDMSTPTLDAKTALKLVKDNTALFVDARDEEEFKRQHVPGARSMPLSFTMPPTAADVAPLKKYRVVVVYCDTPQDRAAKMKAERFRKAGLTKLKVLAGGIAAYRKAAGIAAPPEPKAGSGSASGSGSGQGTDSDDGDDDDPLSKHLRKKAGTGTGTAASTGAGTGTGTGTGSGGAR